MKHQKLALYSMLPLFAAAAMSNAHAAGECDKYRTSYDKTYCFSKLFVESDNELNEVYKSLKTKLSSKHKQQLTQVQRDWIRYRDSKCEFGYGTINVDCNYRVNKHRTEYLRDRLRECKVGTCRPDMIAKPSW